jgi:hypothetical protein
VEIVIISYSFLADRLRELKGVDEEFRDCHDGNIKLPRLTSCVLPSKFWRLFHMPFSGVILDELIC